MQNKDSEIQIIENNMRYVVLSNGDTVMKNCSTCYIKNTCRWIRCLNFCGIDYPRWELFNNKQNQK